MSNAHFVLGVDPGIDDLGIAAFDLDNYNNRSAASDLAQALTMVHTVRTPASLPVVERIRVIGNSFAMLARFGTIGSVYLEQPAFAGTYARNRRKVGAEGMAAPMSKLYLAIGALIMAAHRCGAKVELVPAPRIAKDQRHILSLAIFHESPAKALHRNAEPSEDALDAIWLGAQMLSGPISFDRRRELARRS